MAKQPTQALVMPDGNEYEFFGKNYYGVCSTAAGTSTKTVSITGFNGNSLVAGVHISVKFTNTNTATNASLNVSGTGTISISSLSFSYRLNGVRWNAGSVVDFVFDGTSWCMIGEAQQSYFYCQTAAATQAKVVTFSGSGNFMLQGGAKITVRFQYAQNYSGTPTLNVANSGAKNIYVDGSTAAGYGEWVAGEVLDFVYNGTYWVIVGRNRATTTYYGVTKLTTSTTSTDETTAATPYSVKQAYDHADTLIAGLTAGDVSITDSDGYFDATTVEGALAEVKETLNDLYNQETITLYKRSTTQPFAPSGKSGGGLRLDTKALMSSVSSTRFRATLDLAESAFLKDGAAGDNYRVTINGTEYNVILHKYGGEYITGFSFGTYDDDYYTLGNPDIYTGTTHYNNPDSALPFCVVYLLKRNSSTGEYTGNDQAFLCVDDSIADAEEIVSLKIERMYFDVLTVEDGIEDAPMGLTIEIEAVQSGSGDPSPTNVREISGWTGTTIRRTGKNLLNLSRTQGTPADTSWRPSSRVLELDKYYVGLTRNNYYQPGNIQSYSVTDDGITVASNGGGYGLNFPVSVKSNTTYTISATLSDSAYIGTGFFDAQWNYLSESTGNTPYTFTTPDNTAYVCVVFAPESSGSSLTVTSPQLELGSTATEYEAYDGDTYTVDWTNEAGTIYGGTLDVSSGTLTVTHFCGRVTTLTTYWAGQENTVGSYIYYRQGSPTLFELGWPEPSGTTKTISMCNRLTPNQGGYLSDVSGVGWSWANDNAGYLYFRLPYTELGTNSSTESADQKAAIQQWLSDNPLYVVYPIDPVTYTLTPQEITMLLGTNTIWADTGDIVSAAYPTDEDITYTFATGQMDSVPYGWSLNVPSGTAPLWITNAAAISQEATDTITASDWSTPAVLSGNSGSAIRLQTWVASS